MNPSDKKVDFDALVLKMKTAGAFDDYPTPLGTSDALKLGDGFHNPRFPGDRAFRSGANPVRNGINIPQDIIDANEKSFSDAMKSYMPIQETAKWMHEYFSEGNNFLHSKSFRNFVSELVYVFPVKRIPLESKHTMQLDSKDRKRDDQRIFTAEEMIISRKVSDALPALPVAAAAYQASLFDYLEKLGSAIDKSKDLSGQQRKTGKKVVNTLKEGFSATGAMQHIIPSVATHYYKNHGNTIGEDATEQDFRDAIHFMMKNGSFRQSVSYTDGSETVRFSCPAQPFIGRSTAVDLEKNVSEESAVASKTFGKALFDIYRLTLEKMKENPVTAQQISRDMSYVLDRILAVDETHNNSMWNTVKSWLRG